MTYSLLLAYLLAAAIAYAGYRARALTVGGAVAACLVGGTIFAFGGLAWAVVLVFFFVSSSALSFLKSADERKQRAAQTFEKGGRRDAAQVLANGGVAACLAALLPVSTVYGPLLFLLNARSPNADNYVSEVQFAAFVLFAAFAGALGAATADTWATEIGVLSKRQPRLMTTGKTVLVGTSGGVTWLGTGASALGALALGLVAAAVALTDRSLASSYVVGFRPALIVLLSGMMGGIVGSLVDSLLGATVQAAYVCPTCGVPTESRVHRCGTPTQRVRGLAFVNNDLVNLAATLTGAIVGAAVAWLSG
jgi:uncharacterized protein (TIGR00297 family)